MNPVETGLYYLKSRYFDTQTKRFLNADSVATLNNYSNNSLDLNLYTYCLNNSTNHYDPNGYRAENTVNPNVHYGAGETVDLGQGWKARIDAMNPDTVTQRHVVVYKNGEKYAQNKDGSPHDGSKGKPPKKVLERLKAKTGWDWNKKAKNYDKNPTQYIICDTREVYGYITSTGEIKEVNKINNISGSYYMPNINFSGYSFEYSFYSEPILGW